MSSITEMYIAVKQMMTVELAEAEGEICMQATSLAPCNQSLSRLQQQGLPAHQENGHGLIRVGSPMVPAGQPSKAGKNGNGSSDSGSNSPEIHAGAPAEPAAPQIVAP